MSRLNPQTFTTSPNGATQDSIADLRRRIAVLERGSGGGGSVVGGSVSDATVSVKGKLQFGGDFDGASTAAAPVIIDATTTVKGKVQLAGHLDGTAAAPTIRTTSTPEVARFGVSGAAHATKLFTLPGQPAIGSTEAISLGPSAAWNATAGGITKGSYTTRVNLDFQPGFTNGINYRDASYTHEATNPTDAQDDDYRLVGNNLFGFPGGEKSTYWFGEYMPVNFNAKGLFTGYHVQVNVLKPAGTTDPYTYNEGIPAVFHCSVFNKGSVSKSLELGQVIYQGSRSGDPGYQAASATVNAGPAAVTALWQTNYEYNDYADYDTTFTTQTLYRGAGSQGITIASFGSRRMGTGILLNSGGGIADEAVGEAGFVRAIVLRIPGGDEVYCVDGFGSIGIGTNVTRNQTIYTSGLPARITLGTGNGPAGTAASGGILFGDVYLYRAGANALATNAAASFGTSAVDVFGTAGAGLVQFTEQSSAPGVPAATKVKLYAAAQAGGTVLRYRDSVASPYTVAAVDSTGMLSAPIVYVSGSAGSGYTQYLEQSAVPSTPTGQNIRLYAADDAGTTVIRTVDNAGSVVTLGAAGAGFISSVTDTGTIDHTVSGGALSSVIPTTAQPQVTSLGIAVAAPATGLGITNAALGHQTTTGLFAAANGEVNINRPTSGNNNYLVCISSSDTTNTAARCRIRSTSADGTVRLEFSDGTGTFNGLYKVIGSNKVSTSHGFEVASALTVLGTSTFSSTLSAASGKLLVNSGLNVQTGDLQVSAGSIAPAATDGTGVVVFSEQASAVSAVANLAKVYAKDVSTVTELWTRFGTNDRCVMRDVARPAAIASPTSDVVGTKAAIDAIRQALIDNGQTA